MKTERLESLNGNAVLVYVAPNIRWASAPFQSARLKAGATTARRIRQRCGRRCVGEDSARGRVAGSVPFQPDQAGRRYSQTRRRRGPSCKRPNRPDVKAQSQGRRRLRKSKRELPCGDCNPANRRCKAQIDIVAPRCELARPSGNRSGRIATPGGERFPLFSHIEGNRKKQSELGRS